MADETKPSWKQGTLTFSGCCSRWADTDKEITEDYLAVILMAELIKLNTKLAQDFPKALRKEKTEPWAIDVLQHWKNVFSVDTINEATGGLRW